MQMELFDPNGKSKFKTTEQDKEVFSIQGGGQVTLDAYASLPTDMPAGTYTMKVTVTDRGAEPAKTAELTRKFEVAEKDFGIVRVNCAYDLGGPNGPVFPSPGLGCVGQVLFLHFGLTGFERDAKTKQPALKLEMRMLDADGKPTLAGPVDGGSAQGRRPGAGTALGGAALLPPDADQARQVHGGADGDRSGEQEDQDRDLPADGRRTAEVMVGGGCGWRMVKTPSSPATSHQPHHTIRNPP